MQVYVNGESLVISTGDSLASLLKNFDLEGQRVAVEINGEIVPRSLFAGKVLSADDQIEIVNAIGGG